MTSGDGVIDIKTSVPGSFTYFSSYNISGSERANAAPRSGHFDHPSNDWSKGCIVKIAAPAGIKGKGAPTHFRIIYEPTSRGAAAPSSPSSTDSDDDDAIEGFYTSAPRSQIAVSAPSSAETAAREAASAARAATAAAAAATQAANAAVVAARASGVQRFVDAALASSIAATAASNAASAAVTAAAAAVAACAAHHGGTAGAASASPPPPAASVASASATPLTAAGSDDVTSARSLYSTLSGYYANDLRDYVDSNPKLRGVVSTDVDMRNSGAKSSIVHKIMAVLFPRVAMDEYMK